MTVVQALILRTIPYGESSLIVNCYTKQFGYQSYILKGIRKSRSKQGLKKALFQTTNILEIVTKKYSSDRLGYLKEARMAYIYQKIPLDYQKKTTILFLFELLYQLLKKEDGVNTQLYDFVAENLKWYDHHDGVTSFHLKFLVEITKHLGYFPDVRNHEAMYFDLEKSHLTDQFPRGNYLEGLQKDMWLYFLGTSFDELNSRRFNPLEQKQMLKNVFDYYRQHFLNFKVPYSIKLLNEVIVG
ncbi:MAG: recombination protein O N-terminal domain-containing protein [Flavobacteriaceae bacterium]|nr:recombination protein O N-terminal domain-containing protein [Flavobacteriaceae bacterium]MCY4216884.1 recombination protein O N-terminal domain-containing protein [Flavobacteriaceae bacterium]